MPTVAAHPAIGTCREPAHHRGIDFAHSRSLDLSGAFLGETSCLFPERPHHLLVPLCLADLFRSFADALERQGRTPVCYRRAQQFRLYPADLLGLHAPVPAAQILILK